MKGKKSLKITDSRMVLLLFGLCWLVYFITYVGRLNYSSAMADMIAEGILDKAWAGSISMVFFFAYGGGQLVNGFLGDRCPPRAMVFIGLAVSGVCNLLMSVVSHPAALGVCWGINGYAQSMIWPPIVYIFTDMLEGPSVVKCCVNITSTVALGTLASYLLSAGMIYASGWKAAFLAPGILILLTAVLWSILFRKVQRYAQEYGVPDQDEEAPQKEDSGKTAKGASLPRLVLATGLAAVLVPVIVHGVLKDGVTSWVPTYISETFSATPVLSILVTTVLPVVNLTGAYAAQFMNQRFFHSEIKTSAFFFLVAFCAMLGLLFFGSWSMAASIALLSVITSSMLAINTMMVNLVPLHFSKIGRSSTVSGFLNCSAYLGSAISTFTIGLLVERKGWSVTILSWAVLTGIALLVCFLVRNRTFRPEAAAPAAREP